MPRGARDRRTWQRSCCQDNVRPAMRVLRIRAGTSDASLVTMNRATRRIFAGGSSIETLGGLAAVVLAGIGLSGPGLAAAVLAGIGLSYGPTQLCAIATIAIGVGL